VALVHGLGEHIGRFARLARRLNAAGFVAVGFDLRGHGRSGGPRGHTPSYEALMDDLADFLGEVRARYARLPLFLYGHSMGGNLVLNFCLRRGPVLQGAIATSPWLKLAIEAPPLKLALANALDPVLPGFTQKSGLEIQALSHDEQILDDYRSDPLVHDRISTRLFKSMRESGLWALKHAAEFPVPLLLMQGTADRIIFIEATREFARLAGKRVTWHAWDGMYHETHNEPGGEQVTGFTIRWMEAQLGRPMTVAAHAGQKPARMRKSGASK
jgi:alpha-beta hydrolase superfamily lysophospholipase